MASPQQPDTPSSQSSIAAWLRLLRLPNLLTVPGDPVAGFLLATGGAAGVDARLVFVVLAALLFYAGGLLMNDVADVRVDRAERPDRPLPSGRVSVRAAVLSGAACLGAGLALSRAASVESLWTALALVIAIALYNVVFKATLIGPLAMGLCRGLSVMLGASLGPVTARPALAAVLVSVAYVSAFTLIARDETAGARPGWLSWLPAVIVLAAMCVFLRISPVTGQMEQRMAAVFFLAFSMAGLAAWKLNAGGRRDIPQCIGLLISALIVLQSGYVIASGAGNLSLLLGLGLLLLWPLNRLLARWVEAS